MAHKKTRFQRLVKRAEPRDPTAWREFLRQDKTEEQIFQLSRACKLADYRIDNNGTSEELFKKVDEIIQKELAD